MLETYRRPQAYTLEFDRKGQDPRFTKRQLETHVGERFNVLLSKTHYELRDGKIFGEGLTEPFLEVIKRGRDYRRKFGNPVDWERENAEVLGFQKIQDELKDAPVGTIMLSISPRGEKGSIYQHNSYDVHKKGDGHIETTRYSSALNYSEYSDFMRSLGVVIPQNPKAAFFLSNPVKIEDSRFKSADDIHKYLHKSHEYLSIEEFKIILDAISPLITSYINALSKGDEWMKALSYNAILNRADEVYEEMKQGLEILHPLTTTEYVYILGTRPVKQKILPCGISGAAQLSNDSSGPFSVSEFGDKTILCCKCPFCNQEVKAVIAGGKIICPDCGKSAPWNSKLN